MQKGKIALAVLCFLLGLGGIWLLQSKPSGGMAFALILATVASMATGLMLLLNTILNRAEAPKPVEKKTTMPSTPTRTSQPLPKKPTPPASPPLKQPVKYEPSPMSACLRSHPVLEWDDQKRVCKVLDVYCRTAERAVSWVSRHMFVPIVTMLIVVGVVFSVLFHNLPCRTMGLAEKMFWLASLTTMISANMFLVLFNAVALCLLVSLLVAWLLDMAAERWPERFC